MADIPLEGGGYATIDDEDEHWLRRFRWRAERAGHTVHAVTQIDGSEVTMHGLLLGGASEIVHIDHDGLNNCRSNLRGYATIRT